MFYVHKSVSGWKYVIEALHKSGFCVTSTHTLRTESGAGVIVRNKGKKKSSIFHSLLLTARKRKGNETADILDVETEIRKKMEERFAHLQETYGNDRLNLMVAASGIVIETITSYSEITSFSKDIAEYSLEIGQRFLIELFAKNIIKAERVDPKTMLYVWFRYSPIDRIPFSEFNQTLKALGTEESLVADIIMKSKDTGDKVQLLDFANRGVLEIDGADPVTASSEIDAVHMTLRAYMRGGLTAAESTIKSTPFGEQILFKIIKALADIYQTKTDYSEGEICFQFLKDAALIKGISTIIDDFPTDEE
jgi:adenine-specific DNA methylase